MHWDIKEQSDSGKGRLLACRTRDSVKLARYTVYCIGHALEFPPCEKYGLAEKS